METSTELLTSYHQAFLIFDQDGAQAAFDFLHAISEQHPHSEMPGLAIGQIYENLGDQESAIKSYQQAN